MPAFGGATTYLLGVLGRFYRFSAGVRFLALVCELRRVGGQSCHLSVLPMRKSLARRMSDSRRPPECCINVTRAPHFGLRVN